MAKFIKSYLPQCLSGMIVEYLVPPTEKVDEIKIPEIDDVHEDYVLVSCPVCYNENVQSINNSTGCRYYWVGNKHRDNPLFNIEREYYYCEHCKKIFALSYTEESSLFVYTIDTIEYDGKKIIGTPTFNSVEEVLDMHKYIKFHWVCNYDSYTGCVTI